MFDRRLIEYFDWKLFGMTLVVIAFGLVVLYSSVTTGEDSPHKILFKKQILWLTISGAAMVVMLLFNYRWLDRLGPGIYVGCILLLVGVLLFGRDAGGSRRWLLLGPLTLQPSELTKLVVIIIVARYYSRNVTAGGFTLRKLLVPMGLLAVPFVLIVKQPDLGTALLIAIIVTSMTLFVKIERRSLLYIMSAGLTAVPLIWCFALKGYQKERILTFLNPNRDPMGAGYHIIQSKIAIGSGMFSGKGFLNGTQKALSFLPEQYTDFVLSVLAEECGFIGSVSLLFGFLVLIFLALNVAYNCRNAFGSILCFGVTAMLFWQVFINTCMVMGLMPVVGVPLPLVSYGGSSVLTTMLGIGILLNVSMRRFVMD
jgi:rod shape determining protein RodA